MALTAGFQGPTPAELRAQQNDTTARDLTAVIESYWGQKQNRDLLREQQRQYNVTTMLKDILKEDPYTLVQTEAGRKVLAKTLGDVLQTNNPRVINDYMQNYANASVSAERQMAAAQSAYAGGRLEQQGGGPTTQTPPAIGEPIDISSLFNSGPATVAPQMPQTPNASAPVSTPAETPSIGIPEVEAAILRYNRAVEAGQIQGQMVPLARAKVPGFVEAFRGDKNAPREFQGIAQRVLAGLGEDISTITALQSGTAPVPTTVGSQGLVRSGINGYLRPVAPSVPSGDGGALTTDQASPVTRPGVSTGVPTGARASGEPALQAAPQQGMRTGQASFREFLFDNPQLLESGVTPLAARTWREGLQTDEQLKAGNQKAWEVYQASKQGGAPATAIASQGGGQVAMKPGTYTPEQQEVWIRASSTPEGRAQLAQAGIQPAPQAMVAQYLGKNERELGAQTRSASNQARRWVASAGKNEFDNIRAQAQADLLQRIGGSARAEDNAVLTPIVRNWADLEWRTKEAQIGEIEARANVSKQEAALMWDRIQAAKMQAIADAAAAQNEAFKTTMDGAIQALKSLAEPIITKIANEPNIEKQNAAIMAAIKGNPALASAYNAYQTVMAAGLGLKPSNMDTIVGNTTGFSFWSWLSGKGGQGATGPQTAVPVIPGPGGAPSATRGITGGQSGMEYTLPGGR